VLPYNSEDDRVYLFGPFRVKVAGRSLFYGSKRRPISERVFRLLLALIEARGTPLSREELAVSVWGDVFVTANNINQHIYMLREVLDDCTDASTYVVTVPGRGYCFGVNVTTVRESAFWANALSADPLLDISHASLDRYCGGILQLERLLPASLTGAQRTFDSLLEVHGSSMLCLSAAAKTRIALAENGFCLPRRSLSEAQQLVEYAVKLEPYCSEARALKGLIALFLRHDREQAKREVEKALHLDRGGAWAYVTAAWISASEGLPEQAVVLAREAVSIAPSSMLLQVALGRVAMHAGHYDEALSVLSGLVDNGPSPSAARRWRAMALLLAGYHREALHDLSDVEQDDGKTVGFCLPLLVRALAESRREREAQDAYAALASLPACGKLISWSAAAAAASLQRWDDARTFLKRSQASCEPLFVLTKRTHWFANVSDFECV